jgi:malate dehydrogenase (oxaloacetate-decarboxylating)(NADP+)
MHDEGMANKGTAFAPEERRRLGLDGLLPPRVETLAEQAVRVLANVRAKASALDKYQYLREVQDENETVFFRVLVDNLQELLPVVYTPAVGDACLQWSRIFVRPRGIYLSLEHRGRIAQALANWRREVRIIVVTDGGRILGLGDLGANGMGIPIGKLALYTACAGIAPEHCLPVTLDVGTANRAVRDDPLYLGTRAERATGEAWEAFVEEFVAAAQSVFPGAVVQFEDFNNACAFRLIARYRDRLCCFNDDVQGTGAMGLAGLYAAGRITGKKLAEQRILFVGAGEACLGIGGTVLSALRGEGLSLPQAKQRCLFVDSQGLVVASRTDLSPHKRAFAQERAPSTDLASIVESFRPTVLIGASGKGGLFTQPVLEAMARVNERPVVLALSNPTANAECTAAQAYAWTGGRAVFASGSPFPAVEFAGGMRHPGQANNSYIFPGVGLGLLVSRSRRATDEMFFAAAQTLASTVTATDLEADRIFPLAARMRDVAARVATAVAAVAYEQGHAAAPRPADLQREVAKAMYQPEYRA